MSMSLLFQRNKQHKLRIVLNDHTTIHICSYKMVFSKYATNLQKNTHAEVRFQKSCKAALLKSHFGMSVRKFAAYFQIIYSLEHLARAISNYRSIQMLMTEIYQIRNEFAHHIIDSKLNRRNVTYNFKNL